VIFDVSGSMSDKIDKSRQAVVEFFRTANPQDEFFLINLLRKPEVLVDFTSSIEDIQSRLVYAIPKDGRHCWDAIYLGHDRMQRGALRAQGAADHLPMAATITAATPKARIKSMVPGSRCSDLRYRPL